MVVQSPFWSTQKVSSIILVMPPVVEDELGNSTFHGPKFWTWDWSCSEATAGYGKSHTEKLWLLGMVQVARVAEKKGLIPKGITTRY